MQAPAPSPPPTHPHARTCTMHAGADACTAHVAHRCRTSRRSTATSSSARCAKQHFHTTPPHHTHTHGAAQFQRQRCRPQLVNTIPAVHRCSCCGPRGAVSKQHVATMQPHGPPTYVCSPPPPPRVAQVWMIVNAIAHVGSYVLYAQQDNYAAMDAPWSMLGEASFRPKFETVALISSIVAILADHANILVRYHLPYERVSEGGRGCIRLHGCMAVGGMGVHPCAAAGVAAAAAAFDGRRCTTQRGGGSRALRVRLVRWSTITCMEGAASAEHLAAPPAWVWGAAMVPPPVHLRCRWWTCLSGATHTARR